MTKEEKLLLLQDLCGRLPYKVKGLHREQVHTVTNIEPNSINPIIKVDSYDAWFPIEMFKPYLRPMSSMTEKEYTEYRRIQGRNCDYSEATICVRKSLYTRSFYDDNELIKITVYYPNPVIQDWLNKKMFDYRGLIPRGLALEATEGMYNTKTE